MALAERQGSSGIGVAYAPNNINLGWLSGRGQTSDETRLHESTPSQKPEGLLMRWSPKVEQGRLPGGGMVVLFIQELFNGRG
jgi:hypothetical protein